MNQGSIPNGFRKSSSQQTERCSRVCRTRVRRRYRARRVLDFLSGSQPYRPVGFAPTGRFRGRGPRCGATAGLPDLTRISVPSAKRPEKLHVTQITEVAAART